MNYEAVYRTAPATPGLLISITKVFVEHPRLPGSFGESICSCEESVCSRGRTVCTVPLRLQKDSQWLPGSTIYCMEKENQEKTKIVVKDQHCVCKRWHNGFFV